MLILWIFLLSDVIFLTLGCGLFIGSLSSADKMEKGKDLFECQIHDNKLFWSEVAAIFNSRKQASTYTT